VLLQALRTIFVETQHGVVQHVVPVEAAELLLVKQLPAEAAVAFEIYNGCSTPREGANSTFYSKRCKCALGICTSYTASVA
jgi:hypothetical protein